MPRPVGVRKGSAEAMAWALAEMAAEDAANLASGAVAATGRPVELHYADGVPASSQVQRIAAARASNAAAWPKHRLRPFADRVGVAISSIEGTGAAGTVTRSDLAAAAFAVERVEAKAGQELEDFRIAGAASQAYLAAASSSDPGAMALNPLPARARAEQPEVARMAAAKAAPPSLFSGGHLPAFTASGLPPSQLLSVPWNARHAMGAAPTTADAYDIVDSLSGLPPDEAEAKAHDLGYHDHPGVARYEDATKAWMANGPSPEQRREMLLGSPAEQRQIFDAIRKTGVQLHPPVA